MTPIYLEKGVVWEIFMQIRERIEKIEMISIVILYRI